ncbi:MAG: hypothetical protein ABIH21_04645 [Patescibacteria group bacterium]
MQSKKMAKPKPGVPTQNHLNISEIRDDVVIMKDGTARAVLLVSSINFALKSSEEQEAVVQAYITFLNSLDYPLQICVQSRKMNIDPYLQSLDTQERKTENDLLRAQIADYKSFIVDLLELGEIMQKRFYVVVPYDPLSNKKKSFINRVTEVLSPFKTSKVGKKQFSDLVDQIGRRSDIVMSMLASMGLESARLDTQSLIELYYNTYNPDLFDTEKLQDVSKIRLEDQ